MGSEVLTRLVGRFEDGLHTPFAFDRLSSSLTIMLPTQIQGDLDAVSSRVQVSNANLSRIDVPNGHGAACKYRYCSGGD
jgi:hypothetical protein